MNQLNQEHAPIYEALENFGKMRVVPFDVPGHKRGRGNPELAALLGEKCVGMDVNSMKGARTCEEAKNYANSYTFHMAILDINLPDGDRKSVV